MGLFWKKQEKVEQMLDTYFERCDHCFELFEKAISTYMEMGQGVAFEAAIKNTHQAESAADDQRRDIEHTLYGKALLPDSRGDVLGLLETFDQMPGIAENILFAISCQRLKIKPELLSDIKALVDVNLQAYYLTRKAVDNLMNNPRVTLHSTKDVDERESESDRIERQIICKVFDTDEELAWKIIIRDLVLLIGQISDAAEKTADLVGITAIKRRI